MLALVTSGSPAQAQVWLRPAYPGTNPWLYRFQYSGMYFPSPTGGYGFYTQRRLFFSSPLRYTQLAPGTLPVPGVTSPYYGSSSGMNAAGLDLAAREQFAVRQAQLDARNLPAARQQLFDRWANERANRVLDDRAMKNAPDALREAMTNPSPEDLGSGKSLNELLAAIQELELAGAKAQTPFLPPEALRKINFTGGAAADALTLVRTGTIRWPEALQAEAFQPQVQAIQADVTAMADQIRAGKKIDAFLTERLQENVRKLKMRSDTSDVQTAAYLSRLDEAAKYLKSAEGNTLVVPGWQSTGVTLSDLSKYMAKHGLQFGAGLQDDRQVYSALHRGMVGYYNQLAANRR